MSNKITSAPAYWSQQFDNKLTKWIEYGIGEEHIKYYDYKGFSNFKVVGSGSFGKVYRAHWKSFRTTLALKTLEPSKDKSTDAEKIIYEIKIQRKVHCYDNIIKFYGVTKEVQYDGSNKYMLVMEYADSGTLRKYLEKNFKHLTWDDKFRMAHQLASAILFLHDENIIHRDLHPKNVLIHQNTIKLADFGVSKNIDEILVKSKSIDGVVPYVDPKRFTLDKKYSLNKKSDIYSIGVLLWEISSGRQPFKGTSDYFLIVNIPKGRREDPIPNTPRDYVKIYTDCWKYEPDYRPDIRKVVTRLETVIAINNSIKDS